MLFQERILKIADQYLGSGTILSLTQMTMLTSASQSQKSQDTASGYSVLEKKLNVLIDDVGELKNAISDMLTLNKEARIPLGLHRLLRDTLKCKICLSVPMTPPIIISRCCKTVVGCEKCVNEWYSGPDALIKTCPSCRAERGYNETMLLRGFDDFITEVQKVIQTQDERDNEELPAVTL